MRVQQLGPFADISRLTLGGGGLGQLWGETSPEEARATVHAALDAGINLIDTAPSYRLCEQVIAETFAGALPAGVRITTKCLLGEPPAGTAAQVLEASLDASLGAMGLDYVDVFFLHSNICEDDTVYAFGNQYRAQFATPWSVYVNEAAPTLEDLKRRGRIGAWGITGVGLPATIIKALDHAQKPDLVQAITNLMDSAGAIRRFAEPARPRDVIAGAQRNGVGVMGIRAVQAGALTAAIDRPLKDSHPEVADYRRAAPYRALCEDLRVDPALLAHRYALDMAGVDTVVLGVKNRGELAQCLEAEAEGPLPAELRARIEGLGLAEAG
jgi:aryl-alcohol dehydrogenase-like predicted oxidoreductase